ncbi:MAG TPA: tRNA preQ1(34) S-adenosylmethionine ribosyltransferase-isomerase QueA [Longimicrobiales bacterium]
MKTDAFDYELPPERIAQHPAERRDQSRLLVLERATGRTRHLRFAELPSLVAAGDALVLNETRVFPARLLGRKPTGAPAEILLLRPLEDDRHWLALVRPGSKLKPGRVVDIADDFRVRILDSTEAGERVVELLADDPAAAIERYGRMPLPPYIVRDADADDAERYQTVYAREAGSVAAPTAGLHFTPELLDAIAARGATIERIVLHVGVGTFRPVEVDDPAEHRMHAEWYHVPDAAAARLNAIRSAGGALWAVGTTVARTLETIADDDGVLHAGSGWTDIFIRPPYRFRALDRLITNFHLPRSTLLMLVSAFGGHDAVMAAYREAVEREYRFYSYGDAMALI